MHEIQAEFSFAAAHRLPRYQGKCVNLHGHNYKLAVTLRGEPDPYTGIFIDLRYAHSFALDPARIPGLARGPRAPRFAHETAFALRVPPGTEVRLDPTEHDAHRWVPIPEALELLPFAGLRRAIRMASSGPSAAAS